MEALWDGLKKGNYSRVAASTEDVQGIQDERPILRLNAKPISSMICWSTRCLHFTGGLANSHVQ